MSGIENRKVYCYVEPKDISYENMDFRDLIERRLETAPDKVLYTYTDYREGHRHEIMPIQFKKDCQAASVWIYEKGHKREHMAIMGNNSYEWIVAMFSIVSSDNVCVPVDKNLDADTLAQIIKNSDSSVLFYDKTYQEKAKIIEEKLGITLYSLDDMEQMIQEGEKLIEAGKDEGLHISLDKKAPAFIIFTSGTTGERKGVVLSQYNLISNSYLDNENVRFFCDVVILLPFHHCFGLNTANIPHLLSGRTMHINQNMRYMYQEFQAENPEGELIVPLLLENYYDTLWRRIRESGKEDEVRRKIEENKKNPELTPAEIREMFKEELSFLGNRMYRMYTGGAPLNEIYHHGFKDFGIEILQGYGITECSPVLANHPGGHFRSGSVGRIIPGIEVKIDNPNKDNEGEVCIRGPIVMLGYYKNEEATKEVMEDGWFHTGDLGYIDDENYLYITGRKKNLIILSNGENVSPEEIEAQLLEIQIIKEVVVYEKDDKIAAQIFLNEEYIAKENIEEPEKLVQEKVAELNLKSTNFRQISIVEYRKTPFLRNSSQKIKRDSVE